MSIPLVDLKSQYQSIKGEVDNAIQRVIENAQFILGPEVGAFESEIAAYTGTKYAIGLASGTDALRLALLACGLKPGEEVITTPFTFVATVEAITQCGCTPVFVDLDPGSYNIDATKIEAAITRNTRAILPVHLYGHPAEMDAILHLADRYKLRVIEDCAQALGAKYKDRRVGSAGDVGCLSFFPSKTLGAYGDGGMAVTDDPKMAERIVMLRNHGCQEKYYHLFPGFNSRLDELQAAVLRVKLRHFDNWIERRRQKALTYSGLFRSLEGVTTPCELPDVYHAFNYYTVRLDAGRFSRKRLQQRLSANGISTAIYYPLSLHLQPVCSSLGYRAGSFPESEKAQEEVISLPIYPELSEEQMQVVVRSVEDCMGL